MPNGSSCAKRLIIRAEKHSPADNMAWTVSQTVEWTKCRLYYFDCRLDIWFLTQFHTVICPGQKVNFILYRFLHLCKYISSLVWGGCYRGGWVWHLSFSSHIAHHIWTTEEWKFLCKRSDELTHAPMHNIIEGMSIKVEGSVRHTEYPAGFWPLNVHHYLSISPLLPPLCLQLWDDLLPFLQAV